MKTTTFSFSRVAPEDRDDILHVLNYYAEHSFAAYAEIQTGPEYFSKLFEIPGRYPFYVIRHREKIAGFGLLRPYNPLTTFDETAEVTYFILPDFTQRGLGKRLLNLLEESASELGINHILANISSRNMASLNFHLKYGFREVGRFPGIGKKFGKYFDIVWMQKTLQAK